VRIEPEEDVRLDRVLFEPPIAAKVHDGVERAGAVRFEGQRDRVAGAIVGRAVNERGERNEAAVVCPTARVERDDASEIRTLMPQLGRGPKLVREEVDEAVIRNGNRRRILRRPERARPDDMAREDPRVVTSHSPSTASGPAPGPDRTS